MTEAAACSEKVQLRINPELRALFAGWRSGMPTMSIGAVAPEDAQPRSSGAASKPQSSNGRECIAIPPNPIRARPVGEIRSPRTFDVVPATSLRFRRDGARPLTFSGIMLLNIEGGDDDSGQHALCIALSTAGMIGIAADYRPPTDLAARPVFSAMLAPAATVLECLFDHHDPGRAFCGLAPVSTGAERIEVARHGFMALVGRLEALRTALDDHSSQPCREGETDDHHAAAHA